MSSLVSGMCGFITAWVGCFIGIVFSAFMKERGRRCKGSVLGLLGGFTLGIVFFDLLPEAFEAASLYIAVVGILLGLILAVILDGKLEYDTREAEGKSGDFFKVAVFMAIGIGIHNLPSGVALGSLVSMSFNKAMRLAIALVLHGIPEGLTLGIFFKECRASKLQLIFISILISLPMGIGTVIGGFLKTDIATSFSLAFAGALILYITLRETLPSASDIWKGRVTTIGNVIGIIIGMIMISFFH